MKTQEITARGIRFSVERNGEEAGHAFLYILTNNLHEEPFGFLENVEVKERYRRMGIGNEIVREIIARAKSEGCYKLIATSKNDGLRDSVHDWYQRLGFVDYGKEFRIDF